MPEIIQLPEREMSTGSPATLAAIALAAAGTVAVLQTTTGPIHGCGNLHAIAVLHRIRVPKARISVDDSCSNRLFGFAVGGDYLAVTIETDAELLGAFVERTAEQAFGHLVQRYLHLV